MAELIYWTHGVGLIAEYPERTSRLLHAGWGTLVEQLADPEGRHNNWFHLMFHTPTSAWGGKFRLVAELNENAAIRELHIRMGERLISGQAVDLRGPRVDHTIDLTTPAGGGGRRWPLGALDPIDGGLELSTRVEFFDGAPRGRVIFRGASTSYVKVGASFLVPD